ncbi:MAG: hypothetical protein R6V72_20885 [Cyclobacterium sp.]
MRAAKELEISLASDMKNFGQEHAQTVILRLNLAVLLYDLHGKNNLLFAHKHLTEALPLAMHHYGGNHSLTTSVKSWLKKVEDDLEKGE